MASAYPPPPPYFKLFNNEYKGKQVLPPPPVEGTFTMFGQTYSVSGAFGFGSAESKALLNVAACCFRAFWGIFNGWFRSITSSIMVV